MGNEHARWFMHDVNARNDPKLKKMRLSTYGKEGVCDWWSLCEYMGERGLGYGYKFNRKDEFTMNDIAEELHISREQLEKFIDDCINVFVDTDREKQVKGLLQTEGDYFWSERFLEKMKSYDLYIESRRVLGKKGGLSKKKVKEEDDGKPNAFRAFEQNIGLFPPIVADYIKDAIEEYTEDWVIKAIEEAARQNKRSWSYIEAILRNSKEKNQIPGTPKEGKQTAPEAPPRAKTVEEVMKEQGRL